METSEFGILSRGWVDAAHRDSLTCPSPLAPDRWYDVTISLNPNDAVVPAGHVLGVVLVGSDGSFTTPATTGASIDVDLAASRLILPLVGSEAETVAAEAPPSVIARPRPSFVTSPDKHRFGIRFR